MRDFCVSLTIFLFVIGCKNEASSEASFLLSQRLVQEVVEMQKPNIREYFGEAELLITNGIDQDFDILIQSIYEEYGNFPSLTFDTVVFHNDKVKAGVPYYYNYLIRGQNGKTGNFRVYIDPDTDLVYTVKVRHTY